MIDGDTLIMHAIYRNPADYPGLYVGRAWSISGGSAVADPRPFAVARTLDEVRRAIPAGSDSNIGREPGDDPCLVETWI